MAAVPQRREPWDTAPRNSALEKVRQQVAEACTACGRCQRECAFLQRWGVPGEIAVAYNPDEACWTCMPFTCSLCRLCEALCPLKIPTADLILEMRRDAEKRQPGRYSRRCRYLGYEARGVSPQLSCYILPHGCRTVFFPGCTLPASRPATTLALFHRLQRSVDVLGIVLDCCTKPSHDLGRQEFFRAMFDEMRTFLWRSGVRRVLVACASCHRIFKQYGHGLQVRTVYEVLAETEPATPAPASGIATIHDPCALRFEPQVHRAVRQLVAGLGFTPVEMTHHGETTLCCGEGGSVQCTAPDFAQQWQMRRLTEAGRRQVLTYCAGCAGMLGEQLGATHVLDLLLQTAPTLLKEGIRAVYPVSCFNRLRLKCQLLKESRGSVRERSFLPPAEGPTRRWQRQMHLQRVLLALMRRFYRL